jgi:hypothetical protein
VLGSTGNVYKVRVGPIVSCDCPDAAKGNVCKHQLFVFLRVLRQPRSSELIYQRALLSSELASLFAGRASASSAPIDAVASSSVVQAYAAATGKAPVSAVQPEQRDAAADCPICFEPLGKEKLEVCSTCRNGIHAQCFEHWSVTKGGASVPCPVCRAHWPTKGGGKGRVGSEGFLNLADEAGVSSERPDYFGAWRGGWYRHRY